MLIMKMMSMSFLSTIERRMVRCMPIVILYCRFPINFFVTSKYTIISFIPQNLLEQFRRIANIFFLIMVAIQLIPGIYIRKII